MFYDVWNASRIFLHSSCILDVGVGKGFVDKQLSPIDSESSVKDVVLAFTEASEYSTVLRNPNIVKRH